MDQQVDACIANLSALLTTSKTKASEFPKMNVAAEHKNELTKLSQQAQTCQTTLQGLKKKTAVEKQSYSRKEVAERSAHITRKDQKVADEITGPATQKMTALEAVAEKLKAATAPLTSLDKAAQLAFETPCTILAEAEKLMASLTEAANETRAAVKEQSVKLAEVKAQNAPMVEARKTMAQMTSKIESTARVGAKHLQDVKVATKAVVDSLYSKISAALREEQHKRELSLEKLFEELTESGEDRIPEEGFCRKISSLEGVTMTAEQAKLCTRHIGAGGISRHAFSRFMQRFFQVVKPIAITSDCDITKAKTVRKLELEEVIEVLEGPITDDEKTGGLARVRCRSLVDGNEGWVSTVGNQGTAFLKETTKPYFVCLQEVAFEYDGEPRKLKPDEVLEVLEGPRKEKLPSCTRLRGKVLDDEATAGWITITDKKGTVFAEEGKFYQITQAVAMTETLDMKDAKSVRKVSVGEVISVIEGPVDDEETKVTRLMGKALKDGAQGWITLKGTKGTAFAKIAPKHYTLLEDMELQDKFATGSAKALKTLEKGTCFCGVEGPKNEETVPETRLKGMVLGDGEIGWVSIQQGKNMKPWSPTYKCLKTTPIQDAMSSETAAAVRDLGLGEVVELLDGPVVESENVRLRGRAQRDGACGWITIRNAAGTRFLAC